MKQYHNWLRRTFPTLYPNPLVFLKFMLRHPILFLNKYSIILRGLRDSARKPVSTGGYSHQAPTPVTGVAERAEFVLPSSELSLHFSGEERTGIAVQLDSFDKGGLEEVVLSLVRGLRKQYGPDIVLFVNNGELGYLGRKAQEEGCVTYLLNGNETMLDELVKKHRIEVVNLHYSIFGLNTYIRNDVSLVYTVHNNYIWADNVFTEQRKIPYENIDTFVAVSDQVRSFFINKFGVPGHKVVTIPNGLDIESMQHVEDVTREEFSLHADDFVFLNVSSFNWNKLHVLMIAAMKNLVATYPNFKLLFVGNVADPNCYHHVLRMIRKENLSNNIGIVDFMPKPKILGLMRIADCFLLPSLVEGWSIAAMEAMYSALPLVLSDIGSARNIIEKSDIGLIVPNPYTSIEDVEPVDALSRFSKISNLTNLDAVCEAMADMYLHASEWREKSIKGKQKIVETFNTDVMVKNYMAIFQGVAGSRLAASENGPVTDQ